MARPKKKQPKYRYHISGQAVVTLGGKDFYLGPHDSPESLAKYHALLAEYNNNGLRIPDDVNQRQGNEPITVRTITGEFREHIKIKYANSPKETNRMANLCTLLEDEFGDVPVDEFGPRKLKAVREIFVSECKYTRDYTNRMVGKVRMIFRHAVECELVKPDRLMALCAVSPLLEGQTEAPEGDEVCPAILNDVKATAEHLSPIIKAMVELHTATGMRPSEVCRMRPCDIEIRNDGVWLYRPPSHKNRRRKGVAKRRTIPIVGDVRITLGPYLRRDPEAYCFSPKEAREWRYEQMRKNRKSKVQPSQVSRAKANPKKQPGERYTADSYRQAIERAAKKAGVEHWTPGQIRHMTASLVREALGLDAAQAILGHTRSDMTEHYARIMESKAIEAAKAAPSVG